jgi:hypothetical protein
MTGDINVNGNTISNLPNPIYGHNAVNKQYVDTIVSDTIRNALTASTAVATAGTATEAYVDDAEEALNTRIDNISQRVAALERMRENSR